jgi:phage terminase small subunit
MPAIRKTRAQHEASGAVAKNPARFRNDAHEPPAPKAPIKKAPRHLDAEQQKIWREIVSNAPDGLLGSCDGIMLELAVRLIGKMRNNADKWTSTDAGQLANIMGKLGGTPGDRQRLNVSAPVEKKEKDELDELD